MKDQPVVFGKLNAARDFEIQSRYQVEMGTMILFWEEGNMQEWYEGEHKADEILYWIQSKI